jgi:hypothetical protein
MEKVHKKSPENPDFFLTEAQGSHSGCVWLLWVFRRYFITLAGDMTPDGAFS